MARPHSLTPEAREKFLTAVRVGAGNETAAEYAGISLRTYFRWKADERPQFRQFWQEVERERVTLKVVVVGNLVALSRRSTRAALAWLAVMHPEEWGFCAPHRRRGKPPPVTVAREPPNNENVTLLPLTPELRALVEKYGLKTPEPPRAPEDDRRKVGGRAPKQKELRRSDPG